MEMLEKVEKLREKANVSYEEAKAALEETNGDLLDAMILLEKQGKTTSPESSSYSTKYEDNKELPAVVEEEAKKNEKVNGNGRSFSEKMKNLWNKLCVNYIIVTKDEKRVVKMPLWMFLIILIAGIEFVPIIMIVAMFFGVHYSFEGESEMKVANEVVNKTEEFANDVANCVKDEYNKL